jgi:hypothetical protein
VPNELPRNWLGEPGIQVSAKLSALQHDKYSAKRAGDWLAAMRCALTEIDALAALYSPAC